ncbi:unnamed protein product [Closterium sp. NIES-53]
MPGSGGTHRDQHLQTFHAQRTTHEAAGLTGSHGNAAAAGTGYHQSLHAARLHLDQHRHRRHLHHRCRCLHGRCLCLHHPHCCHRSPHSHHHPHLHSHPPPPPPQPPPPPPPSPPPPLPPLPLLVRRLPLGADAAPTSSAPTRSTAAAEATEGRRGTREHPSKKGV